jgi:hypothetical protein
MPKFQIYIGIAAIASVLVSCQQTPPTKPTPSPNSNLVTEKAISYLRSQLKLPINIAIVAESQKQQSANTSDLCQTTAPTQDGFAIALIADNMRYTLQTNQDASKIEICRSEDAKPETTGKYTGAGYILRYPADWKVIDLGLEASGASTVIFTPSQAIAVGADRKKWIGILQQTQQVYTIISKQPINDNAIASDGSENAKDLIKIPFDPNVKGAKSGSKQEFTTAIANSSTIWKVKVLTLETDKFIYTVRNYQPDSQNTANSSNSSTFDLFANSFALIPSE